MTSDELIARLPPHVQFPERYVVFEVNPGDFRVQSSTQNLRLSGPALAPIVTPVVEGIDAGRSIGELLASFPPQQVASVVELIDLLWTRGILEASRSEPMPLERYRTSDLLMSHYDRPLSDRGGVPGLDLGIARDHQEARRRLASSRAAVLGLGAVGATVSRSLALAGLGNIVLADSSPVTRGDLYDGAWFEPHDLGASRAEALMRHLTKLNPAHPIESKTFTYDDDSGDLSPCIDGANLVILCLDEMRPKTYERVNRACIEASVPLLPYTRLGFDVTIGPLVLPGRSPCLSCCRDRMLANLTEPDERRHLLTFLDQGECRPAPSPWLAAQTA